MTLPPSYTQIEKMIEFMEENPLLGRGKMRCTIGRHEITAKWEELASTLNSMEGTRKNTRQWQRFWADRKYGIKKRLEAQRHASEYRRHFGLEDNPPPLSDLDERIVHLLGGTESECSNMRKTAKRKEVPVPDQPKAGPSQPAPNKATQTTTRTSETLKPRRSQRIRVRNLATNRTQEHTARQRMIKIKEKRATTEAIGWRNAARGLHNLSQAILFCGQTIADALCNRRYT